MVSRIDPSRPGTLLALGWDVRQQLANARADIEDLQGAASSGPFLPLSGGTLTGALVLGADPANNLEAATKRYVDVTPRFVSGNARGAIGDNVFDNTAILTAALAVGPVSLAKGTYATTFGQAAVPGPYFGPGQIKTSDGNKRAPIVNQIGSAPTAAGSWGSVTTAFNGDLSHVPFAIEHRITGAATLTQPTTGYKFTPETAAFAEYFYNQSGWNQGTADNGGRTGAAMHYLQGYQAGQGDLIAHTVSLFVTGARSGATSFLANPAASMLAGGVTAGQAGVYLQGIGDVNLTDGGFDVAGIGLVMNFNRTINTGALAATWMGIRLQSKGAAPIDAFYSVNGPSSIGLDVVPMTTGIAALTMAVGQRIYGNATNADATKYSRYTVPGNEWIGFDATNGWQIATGNTARIGADANGSVAIGAAAIATNATAGFFYIASCAGAPTGVPAAKTGRVPMVIDTTNNKFWMYLGGAWKGVVLA